MEELILEAIQTLQEKRNKISSHVYKDITENIESLKDTKESIYKELNHLKDLTTNKKIDGLDLIPFKGVVGSLASEYQDLQELIKRLSIDFWVNGKI